ncbi:uncharacterized protein LAESUDRAFT_711842 [Laetiporus sulphureus 93-53]|uniref:Uncharacterized protein n=1 Tax=Laetiporus sulphureus 93-53 TaxID=1314785 RepID=A0A165G9A0_9APHY|nr:uncharacterized protein LAESUDRAFT_711842 [Laetiporus sulphureus 93-53]KZT10012.1 hypothetical protein LAESUDRAFT_711842 [Laetiporus sulphureus 93-53]
MTVLPPLNTFRRAIFEVDAGVSVSIMMKFSGEWTGQGQPYKQQPAEPEQKIVSSKMNPAAPVRHNGPTSATTTVALIYGGTELLGAQAVGEHILELPSQATLTVVSQVCGHEVGYWSQGEWFPARVKKLAMFQRFLPCKAVPSSHNVMSIMKLTATEWKIGWRRDARCCAIFGNMGQAHRYVLGYDKGHQMRISRPRIMRSCRVVPSALADSADGLALPGVPVPVAVSAHGCDVSTRHDKRKAGWRRKMRAVPRAFGAPQTIRGVTAMSVIHSIAWCTPVHKSSNAPVHGLGECLDFEVLLSFLPAMPEPKANKRASLAQLMNAGFQREGLGQTLPTGESRWKIRDKRGRTDGQEVTVSSGRGGVNTRKARHTHFSRRSGFVESSAVQKKDLSRMHWSEIVAAVFDKGPEFAISAIWKIIGVDRASWSIWTRSRKFVLQERDRAADCLGDGPQPSTARGESSFLAEWAFEESSLAGSCCNGTYSAGLTQSVTYEALAPSKRHPSPDVRPKGPAQRIAATTGRTGFWVQDLSTEDVPCCANEPRFGAGTKDSEDMPVLLLFVADVFNVSDDMGHDAPTLNFVLVRSPRSHRRSG